MTKKQEIMFKEEEIPEEVSIHFKGKGISYDTSKIHWNWSYRFRAILKYLISLKTLNNYLVSLLKTSIIVTTTNLKILQLV